MFASLVARCFHSICAKPRQARRHFAAQLAGGVASRQPSSHKPDATLGTRAVHRRRERLVASPASRLLPFELSTASWSRRQSAFESIPERFPPRRHFNERLLQRITTALQLDDPPRATDVVAAVKLPASARAASQPSLGRSQTSREGCGSIRDSNSIFAKAAPSAGLVRSASNPARVAFSFLVLATGQRHSPLSTPRFQLLKRTSLGSSAPFAPMAQAQRRLAEGSRPRNRTGMPRRVLYWRAGVGGLCYRQPRFVDEAEVPVSDRGTLGGLTQFVTQFGFAGSATSL